MKAKIDNLPVSTVGGAFSNKTHCYLRNDLQPFFVDVLELERQWNILKEQLKDKEDEIKKLEFKLKASKTETKKPPKKQELVLGSKDYPRMTELYDIVIDIQSIQDVTTGWEIQYDKERSDELRGEGWEYSIVSILGNYNNGKTFTLNKLFNTEFDSSVLTATKGLSIKKVHNAHGPSHIVLDTAGLESPIEIPRSVKSDGVVNETNILANRTFLDHYLQDVVFGLADLFIVVLNDLKVSEQKNINRLINNLKNDVNKKTDHLFILHNFKDCTLLENAKGLWENQVVKIYKYATSHTEGEEPVTWLQTEWSRHLFIMNDSCEEGKKTQSCGIQPSEVLDRILQTTCKEKVECD